MSCTRRAGAPSGQDSADCVAGIEALEAGLGADTRRPCQAPPPEFTQGHIEDLSAELDRAVLAATLDALPVDRSCFDADDRRLEVSHEDQCTISQRSCGVIGLKGHNRHPPGSLRRVGRNLADFRTGRRDSTDILIDTAGRKIPVRWLAVHGVAGDCLGCLETVQDIDGIRQRSGRKRLLDRCAPHDLPRWRMRCGPGSRTECDSKQNSSPRCAGLLAAAPCRA